MTTRVGFVLLAMCISGSVGQCPHSCICTAIEWKGLTVNCSFRQLTEVPPLPYNTIRLFLQNNSLTRVSAGTLDRLLNLQEVDISHNPWSCDCDIWYLKVWLESQTLVRNSPHVQCSAPPSLSRTPLYHLSGNQLSDCRTLRPIKCHQFFVRDLFLIGPSLLILLIFTCFLIITKRLACRVAINSSRNIRRLTSAKNVLKSK
ncbi:glycoprotein IX platelet L homeolog precursor [Xenopus laevis]|uniref:Glycoprotein IX platelet L homeolog precursor n=1 Tax=Xenopus laevis TaxID=8355 RepID=Q68ET8_XENLA|nr:glycoprotein IX platelet L homeolog precursor [Xenopus laevis]AAH80112.1 MGC84690 protein [Xenopus laevis]